MALRIGAEIFSQASTTLSNQRRLMTDRANWSTRTQRRCSALLFAVDAITSSFFRYVKITRGFDSRVCLMCRTSGPANRTAARDSLSRPRLRKWIAELNMPPSCRRCFSPTPVYEQ